MYAHRVLLRWKRRHPSRSAASRLVRCSARVTLAAGSMLWAMSGFQLAASLASSLAWPIVVVVLLAFAWIKREDIGKIFNVRAFPQGRSLRRVRAGPVELEWDQLIESTAEKVAEIPPTSNPDTKGLVAELGQIAHTVPTAAVLEAFARLEKRLREIYEPLREDYESSLGGRYRVLGVNQITSTLAKADVISPEIHAAIINLSKLRTEASHRVGESDITAMDATEYLALVDGVLGYLNGLPIEGRHH